MTVGSSDWPLDVGEALYLAPWPGSYRVFELRRVGVDPDGDHLRPGG
jgi:hypothetical protein